MISRGSNPPPDPFCHSRLANISTRGSVDTGDNVMIGGFTRPTSRTALEMTASELAPVSEENARVDFINQATTEW